MNLIYQRGGIADEWSTVEHRDPGSCWMTGGAGEGDAGSFSLRDAGNEPMTLAQVNSFR